MVSLAFAAMVAQIDNLTPEGRFVRLGPNLLSVNSNTALKTVYGFKSNVRKSDFYTAFWANKNAFNVHNVIDKSIHARKRRVLSHAFSDHAVKAMDKYILTNIETACEVLIQRPGAREQKLDLLQVRHIGAARTADGWTEPVNIANWCDWLTFDIMGDLAFGKAFGMLDHPQNRFAVDLVSSAAHRHLIVRQVTQCFRQIAADSPDVVWHPSYHP